MNPLILTPRHATHADLPALHALIQRCYRGNASRAGWTHEADLVEGDRISHAELAAILDDPRETLLVAVIDGAPAACIQLSARGNGCFYFGLLSVDPRRQANGVGRHMIAAAEAQARGQGGRRMEMTVIHLRRELIAYYERRGYRQTGERRPFPVQTETPLELLVLAKDLSG